MTNEEIFIGGYIFGDVPALMPMTKAIKNNGGSWFNIGSPGQKETGRNPVHEGAKAGSAYRGRCSGWGVAEHTGSKSKAASAVIAKIPLPLARYIAKTYRVNTEPT